MKKLVANMIIPEKYMENFKLLKKIITIENLNKRVVGFAEFNENLLNPSIELDDSIENENEFKFYGNIKNGFLENLVILGNKYYYGSYSLYL
jgi:hypothetical protein